MQIFPLLSLIALSGSLLIPSKSAKTEDGLITYSADELRNLITLRGREFSPSGDIVMDWSGSGFEFKMKGSSFVKASFVSPSGKIAVKVGDEEVRRIMIRGQAETILAENLDFTKEYTVKVYKDNEAGGALCALSSLTFEDTVALEKTAAKAHKMAYLGASITCGNQIDHEKNISAYGAFPRVLSDHFDADYEAVCISGRGLMEGYNSEKSWGASQENELKDVFFTSSFYRDANKKYDLSSFVPEVFVANVGCNDLGDNIMTHFGTTIDKFLDEVEIFHHKARKAYPNAYILYMYGTYQNRKFEKEYRAKVEALNEEDGLTGFEYMPFLSDGADNHPSYRQHEEIASRLAANIMKKLDWKPVDALRYPSMRYELENAEFIGGDPVINADENINYSSWHFVTGLRPNGNVSDPEDISFNGSNAKLLYQEIEISKAQAGQFEFSVGYSSSAKTDIYLSVDEEEWHKVELPLTPSGIVYESLPITITLSEGYHDIYLSGPLKSVNVLNLDYMEFLPLTPCFTPKEDEGSSSSETPAPSKGGCGGSIASAGIALSLLSLGAVLALKKKREE